MARFCTNCGAPYKDNVKYCAGCGQPAAQEQSQPVPQPQPQPQPIPQPQAQQPQMQNAPVTLLERPAGQEQPVQYQQYGEPVKPHKRNKSKLIIILPIILAVLIGAVCLVFFIILPGALNTMAERDFYTIATNDVPTVKYILGEKRTVTGISASTRSDGFQEQVVTYKAEDGETPQQDMFTYTAALCNAHGFYPITDYDFSGVTGAGFQFAKLSNIEGNLVIVQIDYDMNGYTVGLLHGKGTLTIPEASDPSSPEIVAERVFDIIDSGTFHMKVVFVGGTSDGVEADVYRKDGITSLQMEGMGMIMKRILKDDMFYTVLDDDETVYVQEMNPDEISPLEYVSSELTYEEDGTGEFDGARYPYSKYTGARGEQLFYFMDGDNLVGIRSIGKTGNTVDSKILALDGNVPDGALTWPANYTLVDDTAAAQTPPPPVGTEVGIWRFETETVLELLILNADRTAEAQVYYADGAGESFILTGTYSLEDDLLVITDLYYNGGRTDGELTLSFTVAGDIAQIDESAYFRVPAEYVAAVLDNPLAPYPPGSGTTQPQPSSDSNPGTVTADIMWALNTGTYHIVMNILTDELSGTELDMYVKDGLISVLWVADGENMRMVSTGVMNYTIFENSKIVMITEPGPDDTTPVLGDVSRLTYAGSGSGEFYGKSYEYDKFTDPDGREICYYMDGGTLIGIRNSVDGENGDTLILAFDQNIPDGLFDIPEDYEVLDYTGG